MVIHLGSSIQLSGFDHLVQGGGLVIIKKVVGNYVKVFSENNPQFENLQLNLNVNEENSYEIAAEMTCGDKHKAVSNHENLYFAVDNVLKELQKLI